MTEPLGWPTLRSTAPLPHRLRVLLRPGLGIKRWLVLFSAGLVLFGLGVGFAMAISISPKLLPVLRLFTMSSAPPLIRGGLFALIGTVLVGVAAYQIYRWVVLGTSHRQGDTDILTAMDIKHSREQGPHIVAIGGGTGLSSLLRGLKHMTGNLTAIVTIADDGGSSGRLRDDLNMPPPAMPATALWPYRKRSHCWRRLFNIASTVARLWTDIA